MIDVHIRVSRIVDVFDKKLDTSNQQFYMIDTGQWYGTVPGEPGKFNLIEPKNLPEDIKKELKKYISSLLIELNIPNDSKLIDY